VIRKKERSRKQRGTQIRKKEPALGEKTLYIFIEKARGAWRGLSEGRTWCIKWSLIEEKFLCFPPLGSFLKSLGGGGGGTLMPSWTRGSDSFCRSGGREEAPRITVESSLSWGWDLNGWEGAL